MTQVSNLPEELKASLECAWTDFLDANPDDVTSPEEYPDHALVTFKQMVGIVETAMASIIPAQDAPCHLCAGECRGHSLGHPEEWEPEPGSRAAQDALVGATEALGVALHHLRCSAANSDHYYSMATVSMIDEARTKALALLAKLPAPSVVVEAR